MLTPLKELATDVGLVTRPRAIRVSVFRYDAVKAVQFGIQAIKVVKHKGFQRHRTLGATIFVLAVMTDNHVL